MNPSLKRFVKRVPILKAGVVSRNGIYISVETARSMADGVRYFYQEETQYLWVELTEAELEAYVVEDTRGRHIRDAGWVALSKHKPDLDSNKS